MARLRLFGAARGYKKFSHELRTGASEPTLTNVVSQMATHAQIDSETYCEWGRRLKLEPIRHRKFWEFAFIMQALAEHDMLREGRRGLGFGVGREPLGALMAALGCEVVASDAPTEDAIAGGWAPNNQHAAGLEILNEKGICPSDLFAARASFRVIDMNHIPADVRGFDYCWSSCALEHLGSIDLGLAFIEASLDCVKPGGMVVHTTEFNLSSDRDTLERGGTVIFRKRDIERVLSRLRAGGHHVEVNYHPGDRELDRYIDLPPYQVDPHVKLILEKYVTTSFGLLVQKGG